MDVAEYAVSSYADLLTKQRPVMNGYIAKLSKLPENERPVSVTNVVSTGLPNDGRCSHRRYALIHSNPVDASTFPQEPVFRYERFGTNELSERLAPVGTSFSKLVAQVIHERQSREDMHRRGFLSRDKVALKACHVEANDYYFDMASMCADLLRKAELELVESEVVVLKRAADRSKPLVSGRIDMVCTDSQSILSIVEIKTGKGYRTPTMSAALQVTSYCYMHAENVDMLPADVSKQPGIVPYVLTVDWNTSEVALHNIYPSTVLQRVQTSNVLNATLSPLFKNGQYVTTSSSYEHLARLFEKQPIGQRPPPPAYMPSPPMSRENSVSPSTPPTEAASSSTNGILKLPKALFDMVRGSLATSTEKEEEDEAESSDDSEDDAAYDIPSNVPTTAPPSYPAELARALTPLVPPSAPSAVVVPSARSAVAPLLPMPIPAPVITLYHLRQLAIRTGIPDYVYDKAVCPEPVHPDTATIPPYLRSVRWAVAFLRFHNSGSEQKLVFRAFLNIYSGSYVSTDRSQAFAKKRTETFLRVFDNNTFPSHKDHVELNKECLKRLQGDQCVVYASEPSQVVFCAPIMNDTPTPIE